MSDLAENNVVRAFNRKNDYDNSVRLSFYVQANCQISDFPRPSTRVKIWPHSVFKYIYSINQTKKTTTTPTS